MVSVVEKKESALDRMFAIKPSPRVDRLKDWYVRELPTISIERERITVRVMRETEGEPMATRRAKVFAEVVRKVPIEIFPDELFVGWISGAPWNIDKVSDGTVANYERVLNEKRTPQERGFHISEADERFVREEVIPYWKGAGNWDRTRPARYQQLLPDVVADTLIGAPESPGERMAGPGAYMINVHEGHCSSNYEKVLKKGFLGLKKDAEDRLARLDYSDPEELKKIPFLKGVVLAMEAAAELGHRFAALAREKAKAEADPRRKAELRRIAEVCDWVPANPPRTFYEALQCFWFTHILHWWETPGIGAISPGRMDQYFYPFYQKDVKEGRITQEEAQELIDCLILRINQDEAPFLPVSAAHHTDIGGYKADGTDATNELSYMLLEGMMHVRMKEPNFGVLVHSKTPDELLIKATQLLSLGIGHPQFINHDNMIANLLARGTMGGPLVTLELARQACCIGCNEPEIGGMDAGYIIGSHLSLAVPLEYVLTNGWNRYYGRKMGLETGDPRQFKSFEEVREAFKKQLAWQMKNINIGVNTAEEIMADMYPTIYSSAIMDDCIEKGKSKENGGARYNFGAGVCLLGPVDVGNSMAAIEKLVFKDKKITMAQLCDALDKNFEGYEDLRQTLLKVPKFGNDDDWADSHVAWVMHAACQEVIKYRNPRGGHMLPWHIPLMSYVTAGQVAGALPSGRRAGEPLTDSIGPSTGTAVNGPTAALKSVGKINNTEVFMGQTLNMRLEPALFKNDDGYKRAADFVRTFVDQKIHEMQINVISSDMLKAAQREPDKYRDLCVRVGGYVATFVKLPKNVQDTVIIRTEHGL